MIASALYSHQGHGSRLASTVYVAGVPELRSSSGKRYQRSAGYYQYR